VCSASIDWLNASQKVQQYIKLFSKYFARQGYENGTKAQIDWAHRYTQGPGASSIGTPRHHLFKSKIYLKFTKTESEIENITKIDKNAIENVSEIVN